MTAAYYRNFS